MDPSRRRYTEEKPPPPFCYWMRGRRILTLKGGVETSMNSHDGSIAAAAAEAPAAPSSSFKIFHRVVDWITSDRLQLINVTDRINDIVRKSGVRDGIVHLQSLHTTTAVFLNEWQDALLADMRAILEDLVRRNADSHLRGMLMGQALSLQVRNSAVLLGTWQSIILAEFDGPRSRTMSVQVSDRKSTRLNSSHLGIS